jgi:hypothetical protein
MEGDLRNSVVSGFMGLVIGVVITFGVWQMTTTPWDLAGVLVAVGIASFFSAFGAGYGESTEK